MIELPFYGAGLTGHQNSAVEQVRAKQVSVLIREKLELAYLGNSKAARFFAILKEVKG